MGSGTYPGTFGRPIYRFGRPHSGTQITFFTFCFFSCISTKKYVELEINDFKMHLIISKWLRRQKCRQKRKAIRQKDVEAKEEILCESVFIHLFSINHENVHFFFLILFGTCSKLLNDVNSLHYVVWFFMYYFLYLFSSDFCAALTSLKSCKFCFDFMNSLKINPRRRVFHNANLSNLENVL